MFKINGLNFYLKKLEKGQIYSKQKEGNNKVINKTENEYPTGKKKKSKPKVGSLKRIIKLINP